MEGAYSLPKLKAMQILQIGLPYKVTVIWTSNGQQLAFYAILENHSLVTCVKIWSYKKLCLSLSILNDVTKITDHWYVSRTYYLTPGGSAEKGPLQFAGPGTISGLNQCFLLLILNFECSLDHLLFFQLLEEAYHYKRPKDRQGKSEMFRVSES